MTFRDELIEAGAWAVFDSELLGPLDALVDKQPVRDIITTALDAMLAYRTTDECPTCGGIGLRYGCHNPDCTDGRVPRDSPRLAIVEPLGGLQEWAVPVFILATG